MKLARGDEFAQSLGRSLLSLNLDYQTILYNIIGFG